jgi:hypothetical protein
MSQEFRIPACAGMVIGDSGVVTGDSGVVIVSSSFDKLRMNGV